MSKEIGDSMDSIRRYKLELEIIFKRLGILRLQVDESQRKIGQLLDKIEDDDAVIVTGKP